jgi:lipopolysaccharide transport system ATP-binding protein
VEFSGIRKFIDTPVKHYSSGMYVRLAFAVSAHLEPEVMLIDEVLSVGDAEFQKKCLGKLGNVARGGRTVLFVSHNMMAVQSLCERVIWLDEGRIKEDGDPSAVISHYLAMATEAQAPRRTWDDIESAPGNHHVRLHCISVAPEGGSPGEPITVRSPISLQFEYWNLIAGARLNLSLVVYNAQGIALFNTYPSPDTPLLTDPLPKGLFRSTCIIPGDLLNDGDHRVELYMVRDQREVVYHDEAILTFTVLDSTELRSAWYGKVIGVLRPLLTWDTELVIELHDESTGVS